MELEAGVPVDVYVRVRNWGCAPLNVHVAAAGDSNAPFVMGNPFLTDLEMSFRFDCNDFPIHLEASNVELTLPPLGDSVDAWAQAPGLDSWLDSNGVQHVRFDQCQVELPTDPLPARPGRIGS